MMQQTQHTPWQPIETAPTDGSPFWGKVGHDAVRMFWHPGFEAFVSSFRRMTMAPGYTINGKPYEDHSPTVHEPEFWMPIPETPTTPPAAASRRPTHATPRG